MKRVFAILLLFFLMFSIVIAQEAPDLGIGGDADDIQDAVDTYSPLDEEGDVNISKYKPFKSKAEERIDNINLWLEENAPWLRPIFGMVPELSWLFAINLYLILLYLVVFVLNGDVLFGIFSVLENKIDLAFFETRWANILGALIFLSMLMTKSFVWQAKILLVQLGIFWNYVLPAGIAIAVIMIILAVIAGIALLIFAPQVLQAIGQAIAKKKEKKEKEKQESNREALDVLVKKTVGN